MAGRRRLTQAAGECALDAEIRRRRLERVFPRTYARPWDADDEQVRLVAALTSVGRLASLSHLTALGLWRLPVPPKTCEDIHVTIPHDRRVTMRPPGLRIHRARRQQDTVNLNGLPTVSIETAIISCWPMLRGSDQRAPLITACRRGQVRPAVVGAALGQFPRLRGRRALHDLLDAIDAGCESELELWGYRNVFDVPDLRHGRRQLWVVAAGRRYRIDLGYELERVAVELDGRGYHSSNSNWEQDITRDRALASAGWQTVRFSHRRLTSDPAGCRAELRAILAARST